MCDMRTAIEKMKTMWPGTCSFQKALCAILKNDSTPMRHSKVDRQLPCVVLLYTLSPINLCKKLFVLSIWGYAFDTVSF